MSASPTAAELWSGNPPLSRWWGRPARFGYGLIVLGIGIAGETWATAQEDRAGLTISVLILAVGSGIVVGAVLGPAWPSIVSAVAPAGRLAAQMWRPVSAAAHSALRAVARVGTMALRPVAALVAKAATAIGRLLEGAVRRLGAWMLRIASAASRVLSSAGRMVAACRPLIASAARCAFSIGGGVIVACWRPIASTARLAAAPMGTLLVAIGRLASAVGGAAMTAADEVTAHVRRLVAPQIETLVRVSKRALAGVTTAIGGAAQRLAKTMTPARVVLVVLELILVTLVVARSDVWTWWRDGERMTGEVTEVSFAGIGPGAEVIVRDPYTDRDATASLGFGVGTVDVGDTATLVLNPSDPSAAATPGVLAGNVALWGLVALSALAWPLWWRRRWRGRLPRRWPGRTAPAPA